MKQSRLTKIQQEIKEIDDMNSILGDDLLSQVLLERNDKKLGILKTELHAIEKKTKLRLIKGGKQ